MGACCGRDALLNRKVQGGDNDEGAFPADRRSSRVAPMSVLPEDNGDIDPRIVKSLNDEILPFVKQHSTGVYEHAFHKFKTMAKHCPLGQFCPKLPRALLELLKAELATNVAQAKKQRVNAATIRSFEASRSITHQRILKHFRQMLTVPYERFISHGLLADHATVEKARVIRARARGQEVPSSEIMGGLRKVLADSLKLTQTAREVRSSACLAGLSLLPVLGFRCCIWPC